MSIKKVTFINIIVKYSVFIINFVYIAILSRILTQEDFGIAATINVFVAFFAILADFGLGSSMIQNRDLTDDDINSLFSFSIILAIGLALFFTIFSFPFSYFYREKVYIKLGALLSIAVFFSTLNTIPNGLLFKNKEFLLVGIRQVIVSIVSSIIAIFCAKFGLRYYALIVFSIATSLLNFLWNYLNCGLKFRFRLKMESINKIKNYSSYLFGFNLINYFSRNTDNLLIGKFMGPIALGNYNIAYKLMLYPLEMLTHVITPILHPLLAEWQHDKDYVYKVYMKMVKLLSLLGIYISMFCFFTSEEIVYIISGEKWKVAGDCFRLLSISIWAQMINATSGSMFQVLNQTKKQFKRGLIVAFVTVSCILLGLYYRSIVVVSFFVMLAYNSNFITMLKFLIKDSFEKKPVEFLKCFIPDFMIGIAIAGILYCFSNVISFDNKIISFIVKFIVSAIVYLIMLVLTKQYKFLLALFPSKLTKKLVAH